MGFKFRITKQTLSVHFFDVTVECCSEFYAILPSCSPFRTYLGEARMNSLFCVSTKGSKRRLRHSFLIMRICLEIFHAVLLLYFIWCVLRKKLYRKFMFNVNFTDVKLLVNVIIFGRYEKVRFGESYNSLKGLGCKLLHFSLKVGQI